MFKRMILVTAVSAGCSTFAFAESPDSSKISDRAQPAADRMQNDAGVRVKDDVSQMQRDAMPAGAKMEAGMNDEATMFAKGAASTNAFETRLGEVAQQNASSDQVKQMAKMIGDDHRQANQMLQKTAQQNGMSIATDQLSPYHQAKLEHMQTLQGASFDRAYVFGQAGAHRTSVLKYQYQAKNGQGPTQQYAQQILPKLQAHGQQLDKAANQMAGGSGAAAMGAEMDMAQPASGSMTGSSSDSAVKASPTETSPTGIAPGPVQDEAKAGSDKQSDKAR